MKVTNSTGFALVAFGWHNSRGCGEYVLIDPGETKDVNGPYLGDMEGERCYIHLGGELNCQVGPDDEVGFKVIKGSPLNLDLGGGCGITVLHFEDVDRSDDSDEQVPPSQSYCLDVVLGYDESYREDLIEFLRETRARFQIGKLTRGMWQGAKILRIETPKASELQRHIFENYRLGDDCDYQIHETQIEAFRSDTWLPDFDTSHGYDSFTL